MVCDAVLPLRTHSPSRCTCLPAPGRCRRHPAPCCRPASDQRPLPRGPADSLLAAQQQNTDRRSASQQQARQAAHQEDVHAGGGELRDGGVVVDRRHRAHLLLRLVHPVYPQVVQHRHRHPAQHISRITDTGMAKKVQVHMRTAWVTDAHGLCCHLWFTAPGIQCNYGMTWHPAAGPHISSSSPPCRALSAST
jgi:hypothetical protein